MLIHKDLITAYQNTNSHFLTFCKKSAAELIGLFIGCEMLNIYFVKMAGIAPDQSLQVLSMSGQALSDLFEFVFLTMLIPLRIDELVENLPKGAFWPYALRRSGAFCLESMRALGVSLMWCVALLLPGLFKYLRFTFVPYVVLSDKAYDEGKVDALEESNRLVKGVTGHVFLLLVVISLFQYGQTYMRSNAHLASNFGISIVVFIVVSLTSIYGNILLYELYLVRKRSLREG